MIQRTFPSNYWVYHYPYRCYFCGYVNNKPTRQGWIAVIKGEEILPKCATCKEKA